MISRTQLYLRIALVLSILLTALSACVSKTDYEKLQGELRETQGQLSAQQQEVARLTAALSQEQARTADLTTELSAVQSRLTDAQGQTARLEQQVAELKGQLSAAQAEAANLETSVSRLTSALEAEKQVTSRQTRELSQAQAANTSLSQQVDKLKTDLSQAQATSASLSQQIDKLKTDLSQTQSTNTALNSQIGDLRSQATFLQSLIAGSTAQAQSLAQVITQARPAVVRIRTSTGSGSGFFFDKEGRILTNAHVVESYSSVTVVVDDSRSLTGQVLGRHAAMDVAVVRVTLGMDATFLTLGDSDKAQVGEEVLAMGYALGSELGGQATVTKGIFSARRQIDSIAHLQIDAPINPGNSGGPLLNSRGEAIGINASVIRESGGTTIEGIGFAIAINSVKTILPSLIAGTVVATPAAGATTYQNATWRYSIQVASGWTVEDADKSDVALRSPDRSALVQIFANTTTGYTLEAWTNSSINYRRSESTSFTELSRSQVVLSGNIPAYSILFVRKRPDQAEARKLRAIYAVVGPRLFELLAVTRESAWTQYGPTLEQMALSFAPTP